MLGPPFHGTKVGIIIALFQQVLCSHSLSLPLPTALHPVSFTQFPYPPGRCLYGVVRA